jgi:hypothetical protein
MLHPSRPTNEQNKTFSSPIVRCRSFVQVGAAKSTVVAFLRRCPAPQQKILRCDMDRRRLCRRPTHRPTEGHGLSPSMSGDSFSLPFSPIKCLNQRGAVPLLNKKNPVLRHGPSPASPPSRPSPSSRPSTNRRSRPLSFNVGRFLFPPIFPN